MKNMIIVVIALSILLLSVGFAEEETITWEAYLKKVVQLVRLEGDLPKNPTAQSYADLLNKNGFEITAADLTAVITAEEKSVLIDKVISFKLSTAKKPPQGKENRAIIDEIGGIVSVLSEGAGDWVQAVTGMELSLGDSIKTGSASYIYLRVGKFGRIAIKENSELVLKELLYNKNRGTETIILNLALGEAIIDARDIKEGSNFEVRTPTTLAAVRGTIYSVKIVEDEKVTKVE